MNFKEDKQQTVSPLRKIVQNLSKHYSGYYKEGFSILEIGCGNKDYNKELAESKGCEWAGLDPKKNSIATDKGIVSRMPYKDETFDIVICSQSIEHWYEFLTTFHEGLSEIFRVLKPAGLLMMDYPIYLHGHYIFMLNHDRKIKNLFENNWEFVEYKKHEPETPYYAWTGKPKTGDQYFLEKILKKRNLSAYIEHAILKKNNLTYIFPPLNGLKRPFEKLSYFILKYINMMFRLYIQF